VVFGGFTKIAKCNSYYISLIDGLILNTKIGSLIFKRSLHDKLKKSYEITIEYSAINNARIGITVVAKVISWHNLI
jgi:hypothetical protein